MSLCLKALTHQAVGQLSVNVGPSASICHLSQCGVSCSVALRLLFLGGPIQHDELASEMA